MQRLAQILGLVLLLTGHSLASSTKQRRSLSGPKQHGERAIDHFSNDSSNSDDQNPEEGRRLSSTKGISNSIGNYPVVRKGTQEIQKTNGADLILPVGRFSAGGPETSARHSLPSTGHQSNMRSSMQSIPRSSMGYQQNSLPSVSDPSNSGAITSYQPTMGESTIDHPTMGQSMGYQHTMGLPMGSQHIMGQSMGYQPTMGLPMGSQSVIMGFPPTMGQAMGSQQTMGQSKGYQYAVKGSPPIMEHAMGSQPTMGQSKGHQYAVMGSPHIMERVMGSPPIMEQAMGYQPTMGQSKGNQYAVMGSPPIMEQAMGYQPTMGQSKGYQYPVMGIPPIMDQHYQPTVGLPMGSQSVIMGFPPTMGQAMGSQQTMGQSKGYQYAVKGSPPIMEHAMGSQPTMGQSKGNQYAVMGSPPIMGQSISYQPTMGQSTSYQPTMGQYYGGYQPTMKNSIVMPPRSGRSVPYQPSMGSSMGDLLNVESKGSQYNMGQSMNYQSHLVQSNVYRPSTARGDNAYSIIELGPAVYPPSPMALGQTSGFGTINNNAPPMMFKPSSSSQMSMSPNGRFGLLSNFQHSIPTSYTSEVLPSSSWLNDNGSSGFPPILRSDAGRSIVSGSQTTDDQWKDEIFQSIVPPLLPLNINTTARAAPPLLPLNKNITARALVNPGAYYPIENPFAPPSFSSPQPSVKSNMMYYNMNPPVSTFPVPQQPSVSGLPVNPNYSFGPGPSMGSIKYSKI